MGPQTPGAQLLGMAFSIFNSWDPEERQKKKAKTIVVAGTALNPPRMPKKVTQGQPGNKHWTQGCTKPPGPFPGPCSMCEAAKRPPNHYIGGLTPCSQRGLNPHFLLWWTAAPRGLAVLHEPHHLLWETQDNLRHLTAYWGAARSVDFLLWETLL